jgi:hypothetical protein
MDVRALTLVTYPVKPTLLHSSTLLELTSIHHEYQVVNYFTRLFDCLHTTKFNNNLKKTSNNLESSLSSEVLFSFRSIKLYIPI